MDRGYTFEVHCIDHIESKREVEEYCTLKDIDSDYESDISEVEDGEYCC